MNLKKNDLLTVEIQDLGSEGAGIAKVDGYTLFVKDAVVGDVLDVKVLKANKNFGYAKIENIIQDSKDRVQPPCEKARACGGCQLQFMNYEAQLKFKAGKVKNNIERIGGISDFDMKEIIGMEEPFRYRNKSQFPVGKNREGKIVYGFYAGRTHAIIQTEDCLLGLPVNNEIMDTVIEFMEQYHVEPYNEETGRGVVRHVLIRNAFSTGEAMVCLIINKDKLKHSEKLVESLEKIPGVVDISININKNRNNVILGDEVKVLKGKGYIEDYIGDVKFRISPKSFFQVNPVQTKRLYDKVLEYAGLTGKEVVWDLYCGIGSISLFLAKSAKKVLGVEIVPEAIDDARENAKINNIDNATFFVGKAEEVVPDYYKLHAGSEETHPDVIVVDPPRKGCDGALIETMLDMGPERIVYVSCDSATLARDLKILNQGGYRVEKVQPVDMFPQTGHVETVVLMSKVK